MQFGQRPRELFAGTRQFFKSSLSQATSAEPLKAADSAISYDFPSLRGERASQMKLLEVENEYFRAVAVWKKVLGYWSCVDAAPIIKWMVGMSRDNVKNELLKRGCKWQWL